MMIVEISVTMENTLTNHQLTNGRVFQVTNTFIYLDTKISL